MSPPPDGSTASLELTLSRRYIRQKLEHGLGRIWGDVQQKVKVYILCTDLSTFKYDDFIQVLNVVNRYVLDTEGMICFIKIVICLYYTVCLHPWKTMFLFSDLISFATSYSCLYHTVTSSTDVFLCV